MYKYYLFFSLFILNLSYSQTNKVNDLKNFEQKFDRIYSLKTVAEKEAIEFCQIHSFFLSGAKYLEKDVNFQLKINSMLKTKDLGKEIIAFYIIGKLKDKSKEKLLIECLKQNYRTSLEYAYSSLIKIGPADLDFVFQLATQKYYQSVFLNNLDYLDENKIKNELLTQLNNDNLDMKFLLLSILNYYDDNDAVIISKILQDFEKLYAKDQERLLFAIGKLKVDDVLPYLIKHIDGNNLNELEIFVLSSSGTSNDNEFVKKYISQQQTLKAKFIVPLLESTNKKMLHFLLQQFEEEKSCDEYFEATAELFDDEFLGEIQNVLTSTNNDKIIILLVRLLANRDDDISINIMLKFLDSENTGIRDAVINSYSKSNNDNIFKNKMILEKLRKLGVRI